jgi:hypothetical protein
MSPYAKNAIRIQYASGLARGLNAGSAAADLLRPVAPYLALCGNIIHPRSPAAAPFFRWASRNYDVIWWVPGHEEVNSAGKLPGGRFEYGATDNLTAMYGLVQGEGLANVHIANKLAKNYRDKENGLGFSVRGISLPHVCERNLEGVYYNTGKAFTLADLEFYRTKDQQWLERELYAHKLLNAAYEKKEPLVIMTDGYFHTYQSYSVYLMGDSRINMTGFSHDRESKAWFGVNNYGVEGYEADKFVELV